MGLSCSNDDYDPEPGDVCWHWPNEVKPLATKRARKCCSCGKRINPGQPAALFERWKVPESEVEVRIYGEDNWDEGVPRAPWFHCGDCGLLTLFLISPPLNYVFMLDEDVRELAKQHYEEVLAGRQAGCM